MQRKNEEGETMKPYFLKKIEYYQKIEESIFKGILLAGFVIIVASATSVWI